MFAAQARASGDANGAFRHILGSCARGVLRKRTPRSQNATTPHKPAPEASRAAGRTGGGASRAGAGASRERWLPLSSTALARGPASARG
jgi:hypothetical protein